MIGPAILNDLQDWLDQGTRVLLVGDGFQLPPVLSPEEEKQHGEDFSVFELVGGPVLTEVVRSDDVITNVVTDIRCNRKVPDEVCKKGPIFRHAVDDWIAEDPNQRHDHALITWRNKTRMLANAAVRTALGRDSEIPEVGEPVLIRRNGQRLLNGEILTVADVGSGPFVGELPTERMRFDEVNGSYVVSTSGREMQMDGALPRIDDWKTYKKKLRDEHIPEPLPITWGYVLTAHNAQGSEFRRVTVLIPDYDLSSMPFKKSTKLPDGTTVNFGRRWLYTAMSRAVSQVTLVIGPER
jgi:hypothetical protein